MKQILLVHGWAADKTMWEPAIKELKRLDAHAELKIRALDLPGFGERQDEAFAPQRLVQELCVFAREMDTLLVGWSLGGMLALDAFLALNLALKKHNSQSTVSDENRLAVRLICSADGMLAGKPFQSGIASETLEGFIARYKAEPFESLSYFLALQCAQAKATSIVEEGEGSAMQNWQASLRLAAARRRQSATFPTAEAFSKSSAQSESLCENWLSALNYLKTHQCISVSNRETTIDNKAFAEAQSAIDGIVDSTRKTPVCEKQINGGGDSNQDEGLHSQDVGYVFAEHDRLFPASIASELLQQRRLRAEQVTVVRGATHLLPLTHARALAEQLYAHCF